MKTKTIEKKKIDYRHIICIAITLGCLAFAIFYFTGAWTRFLESCRDFGRSVLYYFQEIFYTDWDIVPSVTAPSKEPWTPIFNLPPTWEEFVIQFKSYWQVLFTKENFSAYMVAVGDLMYYFSRFMLLLGMPLILTLVIMFRHYMNKQNNNYNKDSKMLTFHKWLCVKVYNPVKLWIHNFIEFIKANKIYWQLWLAIWLWNFNIIVVFIEFLAYYFYFVVCFDTKSIYLQTYKLFSDLTTPIAFIPTIAWAFIGYWFICVLRKKIGYARLNHNERKNCGFINERPIVLMVCGTMGKKKTTLITDMALSQEVMLKDKAFEKILENDLKFPHFPWINLENALKHAIKRHQIYNLATTRKYIKHLASLFYIGENVKDKQIYKSIQRHLRKRFNIRHDNLCFDYDFRRYGLYFDDKLKVVDLWQVLETYAQLYFVYIIQSSLIISNYSIRTDNLIDDLGNFPLWNTDFFRKDSRLIDSYSRHSHIVDFDALRLGKKVIENNPQKDSFEFGVVNLTEVGKERKNNLELTDTKRKDEKANQKNDGFNDWLKMVRHSATVDMFPFVKVITDEQRPESWGADARDLCEIVHIKSVSDFRLLMPFFTITELLCLYLFGKFENLYYQYRFNRSDNTLFMHLFKSLTAKFKHYYNGVYNTFGCCTCSLQVESGTQDGQLDDKKYYLMSKKIYSKRFSTDCFSDFFTQKALKGKVGINDLIEYETEKASFEELTKQNSYFMNDLINKQNDTDTE